MAFSFGAKGLLGLDIGSGYLKIAQIKEVKNAYELESFEMLPLPPSVIVDEAISDAGVLVEKIKELIKLAKPKTRDVAIALSGHSSVIIKKINVRTNPEDFAKMSEVEQADTLKREAEQYIPFEHEDVNLDYQVLGPAEEEGMMAAIIAAVKKDFLNEYVGAVKDAGLNPLIVDVTAFTLENMYEVNYEKKADSTVAIIDVGASSVTLNILKNGVTVFTRDMPVGSKYHTERLKTELQIPFETAEKLKRSESVDSISPKKAEQIINEASEELIREINLSLDFISDFPDIASIDEILVSGGGALVKGFPEMLANRTGIPVAVANPFNKINITGKLDEKYIRSVAPIAAVAVGLALRKIGDR